MSSTRQSDEQMQAAQAGSGADGDTTSRFLTSLEWRSIGPFRGGRSVAVAADPFQEQVFYFGSTGGGVWKTSNGGLYWENISDGFFQRASVGAIAVAASDPQVIYVGMGETTIRGNVSHGDGIYKSTDGGKTWTHMGLADTRHIGKVRIHPQNPDVVYVAALGHAHGPNKERGIYRTRDGGKSWEQVLFSSEDVGSHDLAMDPHNPRILYAALWRARRLPHMLDSGGEGCGLYKSTDGGDTWTELTHKQGLPKGMVGKIGVTVSGARANRVWASIEAEDGGIFRSDDGGETWQQMSDDHGLRQRPWYYSHIFAHPQDAETVWVLNEDCFKSNDGGRTYVKVATPHGDHHDLWIDPRNPQRIIIGHDGGACVSFDGGETWSSIYNQPTAEFYHVFADTQVPYRVYGGQQDNTTITVPSRSRLAAITFTEAYEIGGGESGYVAVRADDPNIVYAGSYLGYLTCYDHRTGLLRDITVWPDYTLGQPASEAKYRFQWTYPILLSPHDPNELYVTGNVVFRSTDGGSSWEEISPDLTRNDISTLGPSGGPITKDIVGTEYYGTIFAFAESSITHGLFWAGSDDGLVHISRDGGKSWQNVTPSDLPEWSLISIIEPSPHDPATAYLAANRYKLDDFQPYLYKTNDYGASWTRITTGIADNDFTRVIREDPARRGLLYAGTETGVHVSFDDGAHWHSLKQNLPVVPIHDLVVKDDDLVAATHGRSFWILDDLSPLRQLNDEVREAKVHLFPPRPLVRLLSSGGFGNTETPGTNYRYSGAMVLAFRSLEKPNNRKVDKYLDAGQNPPNGVVVHYYLREKPEGEVTLTFLDANGKTIKSFSSEEKKEEQPAGAQSGDKKAEKSKEPLVPKEAGANRFVWNTRYPKPVKIEGSEDAMGALEGVVAPPGSYQVQLKIGEGAGTEEGSRADGGRGDMAEASSATTATFQIEKDPGVTVSPEDLQAQFALLQAIQQKVSATHSAVNTLRDIRKQVEAWERRTKGWEAHEQIVEAGKQLLQKLSAIEEELVQVKVKDQVDLLDYPMKLSGKLLTLVAVVASAQAAPTRQSQQVFEELSARLDAQLKAMQALLDTEVAAFNVLLRDTRIPAILPEKQEQDQG